MLSNRFESIILKSLIESESYVRDVFPFLKAEYFSDATERRIFNKIRDYINQYNINPTKEAIVIAFNNDELIAEDYENIVKEIESFSDIGVKQSKDWLFAESEKWCQDAAIHNAIQAAINVYEGIDKKTSKNAIPQLLSDALGVTFDTNIGHDYVENAEQRFESYFENLGRVPTDLEMFNKITNGGFPEKTVSVFLAGTNVGKSLIMSAMAASWLVMGKNVLYITLEDSQEKIAERVDVNLLNLTSDELRKTDKVTYMHRFDKRVATKTHGKLIVKEYPTSSAHVGHFRHLLNELKLKKKFVPDVILIDYINICCSSRVKLGGQVNTNTYVKMIAEELRGLAIESELPIITATQTNRGGQNNSDIDLDDTAESFGLPQTVDIMLAVIQTEELEELNQYLIKQIKNRIRDKAKDRKFVIGVDKEHQRLYDVAQPYNGIIDGSGKTKENDEDVPAFDKSGFGSRMKRHGDTNQFKELNFDDC